MDDLDIEIARARQAAVMVALIEAGNGPKAVARDLTQRGHPVKERTVASWREGRYFPSADVVALMSLTYRVPVDPILGMEPASLSVIDQLSEHARRIERLEGRLRGWEVEMASAAGREPPPDTRPGAPVSLEAVAWRRRVEELERAVEKLRQQQA